MRKHIFVCWSLAAFCCLVFGVLLAGCHDIFEPKKVGKPVADAGYFSLTLEGQNTGRTIMPVAVLNDFFLYRLQFNKAGTNEVVTETRTPANSSAPIALGAGTWNLQLTAYTDEAGELPAAQGSLTGIVIAEGETNAGTVKLEPIADGNGKGTLSWNIDFENRENIASATMTITPLDGQDIMPEVIALTGNMAGSISLNSGCYRVVFKLENIEGLSAERRDILYVYQNMDSPFECAFWDSHFTYPVTGTTLKEKLDWLNENAQSDTGYTLEVAADEELAPYTLSYSGRNNITVILKGIDGEKIVSLASNGSLFTITSGVTLVLDECITLQGQSNNSASLVI